MNCKSQPITVRTSGCWFVADQQNNPSLAPDTTIRVNNTDFTRDEAKYLAKQLSARNRISALSPNRDNGMTCVSLPSGERIWVHVEIPFTPKIGKVTVGIKLPLNPGAVNSGAKIRTDDDRLFTGHQKTTVRL